MRRICLFRARHTLTHTHTYSTGHVKRDPHYRSITNQFQTSERNIFQVNNVQVNTIANRPQPAETCHAINAGLKLFPRCVYINFLPMSMSRHQQLLQSLSTLADLWFSLTGGNHRGLFEGVAATQHCDFLHPSHGICFAIRVQHSLFTVAQ